MKTALSMRAVENRNKVLTAARAMLREQTPGVMGHIVNALFGGEPDLIGRTIMQGDDMLPLGDL
jgi:hypothetical protein